MTKKQPKKTVADAFFEIEGLSRRVELLERRGAACMDRLAAAEKAQQSCECPGGKKSLLQRIFCAIGGGNKK